ncbi:hypothetical protein CUPS3781_09355, partial [Campylobacter upsaliensis]|nr:hypothetical protein [Campylobacter upsaliensis]
DSFGLKHILDKHGGEFENLARELSEAVENGKIVKDDKGRLRLEYENKIVGIKDNWKGKKTAHWVVTAYVKKEKEASLYASTSFTKGETLPLNSKQSIAQNNKALDYYSKKQNELSDEHDKLVMKSFSHTLNKAEQARLNLLKEELIQNEALKRQEINTLASQKITKYNDLLKTLKDSFNNRQIYNDIYVDLLENIDELIEILKKDDEKIGLFIHQLYDPLKNDNELHGAGISYKAKKLKNGDIRVTGGGISDAKLQKSIRLSEMERERLHLAFAREYNMQGFINDSHREDFFKRLDRAVSEYYDDFHLDRVDYKKYLYSQDRILESDSITQAKQKLEKEREAFREFLEQSATKEANKELKSDLLDKTKPLRKAEKEELTKEVLEEAKKENAKIWVGNLENESLADELGLDFQKGVKITMNGNALKHIENRHGVNSTLAKNGQPIVENEDYANHAKIVNEADKRKIILSEDNQKILVSGKQINGYHIIIESISTKDNELKLKTMYKENGSLENSNIFKEPVRDRKSGGESLRVNPSNALDPNGSSESIAQNPDYLELVKEYGEENAKKIIKQKILSENIAQVLESGEEKFIYKKDGKEYELRIQDAMKEFGSRYDELNLKNDLNKAFLKALDKLKIGYEVLENAPVRIRFLKQNKPEQSKTSANNPALWKIQRDMGVRLKELKAQVKENNERYKNEDKALQKELTNTKDLFKSFEKEFNETKGTILISRAKRRKNDAEGKVETSVFLGNKLALRNALDRWETYSGYSKENALEVKERLELLKSYVKRLEKHRKDIRAKREQLEQDYRQKTAPLDREISVIRYYKILRNSKGMSDTELYEPFLENTDGYLSKEAFNEGLPRVREEFQKLFNITPLKEFGTNYA